MKRTVTALYETRAQAEQVQAALVVFPCRRQP